MELRSRAEELRRRSRVLAPSEAPSVQEVVTPGGLAPSGVFAPPNTQGDPVYQGLPPVEPTVPNPVPFQTAPTIAPTAP